MSKFVSYVVFIGALVLNVLYVAGTDCPDIATETVLHFSTAITETSTLQQEDGNGELRFGKIGTHVEGSAEHSIDLVVKRFPGTPYLPGNTEKNGVAGHFGQINILADDGEGTFEFCFEKSDTSERMTLDAFFFSFYDFDGTKHSRESITLKSNAFAEYYLEETSELHVEVDGVAGETTFKAMNKGDGSDNPEDPNEMSQLQRNRSVIFLMKNTDCFFVKMASDCSGKACGSGRNILFSGRANQLVPTCAPSAAPSAAPSVASSEVPSETPSVASSEVPSETPSVASSEAPSEAPTRAPQKLQAGGTKTAVPTAAPSQGASGDPHFKTWSGERYDYHGICDLILLSNQKFNDNSGMDIYIRSKRTKQWSYISTAVIRIGAETFEVSGRKDGDTYWINGIEGDSKAEDDLWEKGTNIAGYPITYQKLHTMQREYIIHLGENGEAVIFKTWKDFVRVDVVNPRKEDFRGSLGLMGSYPDGKSVSRSNPLSIMKDRNAFGQEWQVLSSDPKLFHSVEGPQHPARCEIPSKSSLRRRLSKSDISIEDAKILCSHVTNKEERDLCAFDVMATSDKTTANAY